MRKQALALITSALLFRLLTEPVVAQVNWMSANNVLPHCKSYVANQGASPLAGYCAGVVEAFATVGNQLHADRRFCIPNGAQLTQGVRVVIRYMEQHPERLHLNFNLLALEALRAAWPCPSR